MHIVHLTPKQVIDLCFSSNDELVKKIVELQAQKNNVDINVLGAKSELESINARLEVINEILLRKSGDTQKSLQVRTEREEQIEYIEKICNIVGGEIDLYDYRTEVTYPTLDDIDDPVRFVTDSGVTTDDGEIPFDWDELSDNDIYNIRVAVEQVEVIEEKTNKRIS